MNVLYSRTINFFISNSSKSEIFKRQAKLGCEVLVRHFETVDGFTFSYSDNHLLVRFFSHKTIFSLFISFISSFYNERR